MGNEPKLSSWNLHPWEEPPISGTCGSGTIFFSGCTASCRFCQNFPISQLGYGDTVSIQRLSELMLELQHKGAHNINFVTPTHFMPQILAALPAAIERGLQVPLVYNSSGYERVEVLRLLEGVVDVWLLDAKYAADANALRLSGLKDYVKYNQSALQEVYRQVGADLVVDDSGLAKRGMIIRHLVLPHGLAGTPEILRWVASELSPHVRVSLMDQYFPAHQAVGDPILGGKITSAEYAAALDAFRAEGLQNGWCQNTTATPNEGQATLVE
jgi:putative pyruvate formate lyase activating enzyme